MNVSLKISLKFEKSLPLNRARWLARDVVAASGRASGKRE
jgi:hypothetical protein